MRSVLIVEDNPITGEAVNFLLAAEGFGVERVGTSREGRLAILQRIPDRLPDCVLVDYLLPDENGFEFLTWLRLQPGCEKIPVVFTSAVSSVELDDIQVKAANLGPVRVLPKPFDMPVLLSLMRYFTPESSEQKEGEV